MKEIANYPSHHEAELAAGFLRDAGIPAITRSDDAGGWEPGLTFVGSVRVMVGPDDWDQALEILQELDALGSEDEVRS